MSEQKIPRVGGWFMVPRELPDMPMRRVRVVAKRGLWMVNRSFGCVEYGTYSVTHIPTGLAAVAGLRLKVAMRALRKFAALAGDWTFSDAAKITKRQKKAGRDLKWACIAENIGRDAKAEGLEAKS